MQVGTSITKGLHEGRSGHPARFRPQHRPTRIQHVCLRVAQGNPETAEVQDATAALIAGVGSLTASIPADRLPGINVSVTVAGNGRPRPPNGYHSDADASHMHTAADSIADVSASSNNGSSSSNYRGSISSSNSSDDSGSQPQQKWQPPRYRRESLRIRSKREVQTAQRAQGQNLIVEDLQKLLRSTKGFSSSGTSADIQDQVDAHLEAFIEQVLCPKLNVWELKQSAPAAPDGSQAVPPEVLASISTISADTLGQLQANLARNGQFQVSLLILEEAVAAGRLDVVAQTSHRAFLRAAGAANNIKAVLRFLHLLPPDYADAKTYNLALKACSTARDLAGALKVMDVMTIRNVPCDFIHFTTLITVCAAAGDVNQAFTVFQKAKAVQQQLQQEAAAAAGKPKSTDHQLDSHVYGALIAACAQGIKMRSSDRKDQLVILDRAFQVLQEAIDSGVHLETPVWNALLMCAGRCRQLQRCFEVLDLMTNAGVPSDEITFTCLIEAAVLAGEVDIAQRVFARAMAAGITSSVQLYTAAINACMANDGTNFDAAFEIYAAMQRNGVEPDDLLYGHLIALAGRCKKLEVAFDLLEDMRASGLAPSTPTCSALIYACLQNNNFAAARKVYDTLIARGVPPHISQYNALLEQYALRYQLGNVVSLLTNMVAGGTAPNANTFRILLLACQRADQAELAFELYQIMKARGLQPKHNNAHSICYTLLKSCYNRIRKGWRPGGYPPRAEPAGPFSTLPGKQMRAAEARQLLHVLDPALMSSAAGSSSSNNGAAGGQLGGRQQHGRRYTFVDNAENINWPLLALSTYRDFISWGYKPRLEILDKLLSCLRLQPPQAQLQQRQGDIQRAQQLQAQLQPLVPGEAQALLEGQCDVDDEPCVKTQAILRELSRERRPVSAEERPYEVPFDKRAMDAVLDAINAGILPAMKLDAPLTIDMRSFPPCVAEAYLSVMMAAIEGRGKAAGGSDANRRRAVAQPVRLIVPPFDPNYVMWPSYVQKLFVHYNEQLLARQAQLRAEAQAARRRAAALAARGYDTDDEEDIPDEQLALTLGVDPSVSSRSSSMRGAGRRMDSWGLLDSLDDAMSSGNDNNAMFSSTAAAAASGVPGAATAAGGRYIAGAITGLAVAATFRRLKAYARVDAASGAVKLEPREINRWVGAKIGYEEERRRLAREAELAASGYSSTAAYYQQHVYTQPQNPWLNNNQQQQQIWRQQQQLWRQQQQQSAAGPAQQHDATAADISSGNSSSSVGCPTSPASPGQPSQSSAAAAAPRQIGTYRPGPGSASPGSQDPLSGPSQFGLTGRPGARSSLEQQSRDIRLGFTAAPGAAAAGSGLQQRPPTPSSNHHNQQQHRGNRKSSSSSSSKDGSHADSSEVSDVQQQ